ncbi:Predicted phosphodiesterase [Desulfotomaculum arcticum]|uniref:Predicted phosphodiesterase n=1 Tax=Desulfotruncus arcticus DSM 17038 TaxID=1121424 RepID=A0A1I2YMB4_9FIRM|nr:metallophosphoesterase family protein [Desulfotruncus arcticus]SFH26814.1 Predicted phosphodiesterase [Desulfotomaculum arcticum] [Desulfotruncus arcticus DSM 17038]
MNIPRIAVMSDIHGNFLVLDAVLDDIKSKNITTIINLGDSFYGPLFPDITANRLIKTNVINIMGNQDRLLLEGLDMSEYPSLKFVKERLSPDHISWIKTFPKNMVVYESIYACHGSPDSDQAYLIEDVTEEGVRIRGVEDIMMEIQRIDQPIILCGHSHVPRTVYLPDGRIIINPGSVGLPAYADDVPQKHKMESYSPHAKYAIVSNNGGGWLVEQISVPYDWNKAWEQANKNNRNDWAF